MCMGKVKSVKSFKMNLNALNINLNVIEQESPTPAQWTGTGLWPVKNRAAQQEVGSG